MATLFDLDRIVLAGPSFAAAGSIYQSVIQVVPSVNGSDAAAIGGAVLVLQSKLTLLNLRR